MSTIRHTTYIVVLVGLLLGSVVAPAIAVEHHTTTNQAADGGMAEPAQGGSSTDLKASVNSPQLGSQKLPLDTNIRQIGSVQTDAGTYQIYRYQNRLPYATRIEVFVNGKPVESPRKARDGLEAYAMHQSLQTVGSDTTQSLRELQQTTGNIEATTDTTLRVLNRVVSFIDRLKEKKVVGVSVWDAATKASPTLKGFDQGLRELRSELKDINNAAATVNKNARELRQTIKSSQQGEPVNYDDTATQMRSTANSLNRLHDRAKRLEERLLQAAETSDQAAAEVKTVPVVGGDIAAQFKQISSQLRSNAQRVNKFDKQVTSTRNELEEVENTAERKEQRMEDEWKVNESAKERVYGSLGVSGVTGLGALGLLTRSLL